MFNKIPLETRRDDRHCAEWRVLVLLPQFATLEGRISNVSAGGLRFSSPLQYQKGDKVSIDIVVSPKNFVRARIAIVKPLGRSGGAWAYGAKFVQMGRLDQVLLKSRIGELDARESHPVPSKKSQSTNGGFRRLFSWFRGI